MPSPSTQTSQPQASEQRPDVLIIGAGIFGLSAALSLAQRDHRVMLLEPGPIPHPQASSTDISKVIRVEYGADDLYTRMGRDARDGWLRWNDAFCDRWPDGEPLYHESGLAVLSTPAMAPGSFEYDSFQTIQAHGFAPERLDAAAIHERFPIWSESSFTDGFFHQQAGFAQSGRVVAALARWCHEIGVDIREGQAMASWIFDEDGGVCGVVTEQGERIHAGHTVLAAGVWTPALCPGLEGAFKVVGQPVFHLRVPRPELLMPPAFCTFTADISRTGWYGFPLHPREGVFKIANHGPGRIIDPIYDERLVTADEEAMMRTFVGQMLPSLAEAPIVATRLCLYCDTPDGDFLIDHHPTHKGLLLATGGSGHGFKFGPVLGEIIADVIEGHDHPYASRFAWRGDDLQATTKEAARHTS